MRDAERPKPAMLNSSTRLLIDIYAAAGGIFVCPFVVF